MADYDTLSVNNRYLCAPDSDKPGVFFLTGICTYSTLGTTITASTKGQQICVSISDLALSRAAAVIAATYGFGENVNFSTFSNGVSFATRFKPSSNQPGSVRGVPKQGINFTTVAGTDASLPYNASGTSHHRSHLLW